MYRICFSTPYQTSRCISRTSLKEMFLLCLSVFNAQDCIWAICTTDIFQSRHGILGFNVPLDTVQPTHCRCTPLPFTPWTWRKSTCLSGTSMQLSASHHSDTVARRHCQDARHAVASGRPSWRGGTSLNAGPWPVAGLMFAVCAMCSVMS